MTAQAKFRCNTVTISEGCETISLSPVYGDSDENKTWSKYTPSGSLQMMITNDKLFGAFKPGKEYYLEITEVSK